MIAGLAWKLIPGELSEKGLTYLADFAGVLFIESAFGIALGAVIIRWRTVGVIIFIIVCMVVGVMFGSVLVAGISLQKRWSRD